MPTASDTVNTLAESKQPDNTSKQQRVVVKLTLTATQYEVLQRRCLHENVSIQAALSAGANAYALGDLRVRPNGRYWVEAPPTPLSRDESVRLRAPLPGQPERTVVLTQKQQGRYARTGRHPYGTRWLAGLLTDHAGRRVSDTSARRLLNFLTQTRAVPPRAERQWRFDGPDDARVLECMDAMNDGRYDQAIKEAVAAAAAKKKAPGGA